MQGITVALSPEGINFFVNSLFASNGEIEKAINGAALADFQVTVPQDIFFTTGQNEGADCSNIKVQFSNGSISNFTPIFQNLQQEKEGVFQLIFSSDAFKANYNWLESYTRQNQTYEQSDQPNDPGEWVNDGNPYPVSKPFQYSAGIGSLATNANLTFTFDSSKNLWELPVTSITAVASNPNANIPGSSILQDQDQPGCVQSHVDSATEASIDNGTDFAKSITTAFGGYLTSIPASGQLYQDPTKGTITFAFGLGDSPLTFPNDHGLTVGVTGISTYTPSGQSQPQQYPGTPPSNLPVPAVPTDGHHLQMYVSDYTINGLYWAFALAEQLTSTVTPADIQGEGGDPSVLYVATYYNPNISNSLNDALAPYAEAEDNMYAAVSPIQPPTVAFQNVYTFNSTTMAALKNALSNSPGGQQAYNILSNKSISSQTFTNTTALEAALNRIKIDNSCFATIESTIQELAAVVTHNLQFKLTIQDTLPNGDAPYLTFTLTRTDILTDLKLGVQTTGQPPKIVQSLQFTHTECQPPPVVKLTASNFIPVSTDASLFDTLWSTVGESEYSTLLADLGKHGVPLPIMEGFQFVFDQALLNIEQGYVGILSDVEFTG